MSWFKKHCDECLKAVRIAGMDLAYAEIFFKELDQWIDEHYPQAAELTRELAEEWIFSYTGDSKQQLDKRIRSIKHLSKYLKSLGLEAWKPNYYIKSDPVKPKTLLNDEEISLILDYIDTLKPFSGLPNRQYLFPIIFRLALFCGMRLSEIIHLKRKDVDLKKGTIRILHSKGWKDREIYISDSFLAMLKRFDTVYSQILPNREFFLQPSYDLPCLEKYHVEDIFGSALRHTGLDKKHPIRPTFHGFRHLFAVKSMIKCQKAGMNFDNQIKYLSFYMGHKSTRETRYYLHSLVQGIPVLAEKMKDLTKGIEVIYEED